MPNVFSDLPTALPGRVISLVGGGGKTTVLYALANFHAHSGKRVLVTTTTKIYSPNDAYYAATAAQAEDLWQRGSFAVIGTPLPQIHKLSFPDPALWESLSQKADLIFIEADGARHHPIKVPRAGEPVILPESDCVLAVMGLSAMGKPLKDCCFGLAEATALLETGADHLLTEADAAAILASPAGSRKDVGSRPYWVILNQCDTARHRASGEEIAALLTGQGIAQVFLSAFTEEEQAYYKTIAQGVSAL